MSANVVQSVQKEARRDGLLQNVVFEGDALRIIILEPPFSGPRTSASYCSSWV
jgi:hypothetical protein